MAQTEQTPRKELNLTVDAIVDLQRRIWTADERGMTRVQRLQKNLHNQLMTYFGNSINGLSDLDAQTMVSPEVRLVSAERHLTRALMVQLAAFSIRNEPIPGTALELANQQVLDAARALDALHAEDVDQQT